MNSNHADDVSLYDCLCGAVSPSLAGRRPSEQLPCNELAGHTSRVHQHWRDGKVAARWVQADRALFTALSRKDVA